MSIVQKKEGVLQSKNWTSNMWLDMMKKNDSVDQNVLMFQTFDLNSKHQFISKE